MCLASAYTGEVEDNEVIVQDIARLRIEGNIITLSTLFGERKELEGTVKEVDFQRARIIIEPAV